MIKSLARSSFLHNLVGLVAVGLTSLMICPATMVAEDPTEIMEESISEDDREHWAFQPPQRPELPSVDNPDWSRNPIDRFVWARLEQAGLMPMPRASRTTLIRRVTFDLTGLPPTPAEVDQFVEDNSPEAYGRLVDRLLASPAYGERWAQHWLDLVRFAETDGFEHDHVRPNAWRYRDWVIDAFNRDMPYDQFLKFQLAGDLLAPDDPSAAIATGFLLCGPDMPDINSQQERRDNFLNDMTGTVGSILLSLNIGCAQCHDHKYEPISQFDFYRLRAFFDPLEMFQERPLLDERQRAAYRNFQSQKQQELESIQNVLQMFHAQVLARVRAEEKQPELKLSNRDLAKRFSEEEDAQFKALTQKRKQAKAQEFPGLQLGRVVHQSGDSSQASFLHIRGDFQRKGPQVSAAYPRVVSAEDETVLKTEGTAHRVALARWLTNPEHPLTGRVIVNRLWQHHFIHGLVRTPSNFGSMGESPSHPQLLDWLATELPRMDWSLKRMHRLMVTSETYCQASRPRDDLSSNRSFSEVRRDWSKSISLDPENRLLSRMNRRRLEGEVIRDTLLAISGRLNRKRGGPGFRPPLPRELLVTLLKNQWPVTEDPDEHNRRSIYLFVRRNLRYPIFDVFDRPDTNRSCPQRHQSTIAPQALMLLNSELSMNAAQLTAQRLLASVNGDRRLQIEECYQLALSRHPTKTELDTALDYLTENIASLRNESSATEKSEISQNLPEGVTIEEAAALADFCLVMFNLNEFLYID